MFGSGYENCPEFGVLVQIIYSEISEQYESKLGWSGM
jgi:hypothetical protein